MSYFMCHVLVDSFLILEPRRIPDDLNLYPE